MALAKAMSKRSVPGRPGERLAAALQELGPSFIKIGQALSVRSDLVGEEIADDLSGLQDRLPPFPGLRAREIIAEELGAPMDALFAEFDDKPIAAASIAQVHCALTGDGDEVAVKVLRPGIEEAFARDLDLLTWVAEIAERTQPRLRRLKPLETVRTLRDSVLIEMDLRLEAAAAEELAENFAGDDTFHVPKVDWRRTARRVLTLERIAGIPIDERDEIVAAGHDPEQVVKAAAAAFFKQVFRDGFFHADQHPGNLFIQPDGSIMAVDFGIMGRLDKPTRHYLGEMLLGFLNRDYKRVAEVHFEAGWVPAHKSVQAFNQACRSIAEPILDKPQSEISIARLLRQLFHVTETFEMETQPQLLLLQKTMLVAEGVGRTLYPDMNMWFLAKPLIEDWVEEHIGPDVRLRETVEQVADGLRRLPKMVSDLEKGGSALARGEVKLHPETLRALSGGAKRPIPMGVWAAVILFLFLVLLIF